MRTNHIKIYETQLKQWLEGNYSDKYLYSIKKKERDKITNLGFHHKKLGKEEQTKSKGSRRK